MTRRTVKDFGPDPIDQYVGSRVRARRVGLRMSQTNLGQTIDVTFQQVQKYENGTNRISASNLYKIAKALAVDVSYFFDGIPESLADEIAAPNSADLAKGALDIEIFRRQTGQTLSTDFLNWRRGIPISDAFFEPDPGIDLVRLSFDEYVARQAEGKPLGPVPIFYTDLLSGR